MSNTNNDSINSELAKRLSNKFIFSALIAFVACYRTELYTILTKGTDWKIALQNLTLWNKDYFKELGVVLLIYFSSGFLGAAISFILDQIVKLSEHIFNKYKILTYPEAQDLRNSLNKKQQNIDSMKQVIEAYRNTINQRTDEFFLLFGFNGQGHIDYFFENIQVPDEIIVFDTNISKKSDKSIFGGVSRSEQVRFFTGFALRDSSKLFFDLKKMTTRKIKLGHRLFFDKIVDADTGNTNWNLLYYSENRKKWGSQKPTQSPYYILKVDIDTVYIEKCI